MKNINWEKVTAYFSLVFITAVAIFCIYKVLSNSTF